MSTQINWEILWLRLSWEPAYSISSDISVLDLSDSMIEEHGPLGTAPSELVKLVLHRKDMEIAMLKKGFVDVENSARKSKRTGKI